MIHKSSLSQINSINLFFFLHHANWVPLSHRWPRFQYCAAASPDTYIHAPWHTPLPRKHVLLITGLKCTWWGEKNPKNQTVLMKTWRQKPLECTNLSHIYATCAEVCGLPDEHAAAPWHAVGWSAWLKIRAQAAYNRDLALLCTLQFIA